MPTLPQPLGKQCDRCKGYGVITDTENHGEANPQEKPCPKCNPGKK